MSSTRRPRNFPVYNLWMYRWASIPHVQSTCVVYLRFYTSNIKYLTMIIDTKEMECLFAHPFRSRCEERNEWTTPINTDIAYMYYILNTYARFYYERPMLFLFCFFVFRLAKIGRQRRTELTPIRRATVWHYATVLIIVPILFATNHYKLAHFFHCWVLWICCIGWAAQRCGQLYIVWSTFIWQSASILFDLVMGVYDWVCIVYYSSYFGINGSS